MELSWGIRIATLYHDHLLFKVDDNHGKFEIQPYEAGKTDDALVLPAELAGIVPGS